MSKAILVIDMPTGCIDCVCASRFDEMYKCNQINDGILIDGRCKRNDCPLKLMPKELEPAISEEYVNYCQGFNDCINEILGEEE